MHAKYLYYPTMSLPNTQWLKRVLLYSDEIASIVPYELQRNVNYDFELLKDCEEFKMLSPESHLWDREFEKEVADHFNSNEYKGIMKKSRHHPVIDIHKTKVSYAMKELLQTHQIQIESENWYKVPKRVADSYMGILAKYMGRYHGYIPTTDKVINENLIYSTKDSHVGLVAGQIRLLNCLPVPSSETSFEEILSFKKERREELLTFRQTLSKRIQDLSRCENPDECQFLLTSFKGEMELELLKIQRLLNENRISFRLESMKSLLEVKNPLLWTSIGALLSNNNSQPYSVLAAGLLVVSYQYIKSKSEARTNLNNSPYAYIFHAQSQLGKRKGNF
ncbi:hypothetical protein BC30048_4433 [Bacillus cereus]|uniref:DUF6236 family protein n=1 Tax=Bacillus cereus group TaxID=86661 RepID=UPI000789E7F1|nr:MULTISPECIES: DUF6236 family protein [Bacillus cereus group]KYQ00969.1 hypothetical protein B4079_3886 [Bacillus cereus]MED1214291.1 DUF6236 family protein [Bacillus paranthracis]BCC14008.1 hypothetical protein BCM0074_4391 [Bacillus cereus]BCD01531.1 hypothetical protein BC30048_4433 [Bacillus cereus]HDR6306053.1 hypothetical protein [Bacillus cereus]